MACENSEKYADIVYFTLLPTAILSLIGCTAIISIYTFMKSLRSFSLRIVLYMAISDLLRTIVFIYPAYAYRDSLLCGISAYLYGTTYLIAVCWCFCISFNLYQTITKYTDNFEKYQKYWVFVVFVLIPLSQTPPFFTQSYGFNSWLCALRNDEFGQLYRFGLQFFPIYSSVVYMVYMYCRTYSYLKAVGLIEIGELLLERGMIYPVIIITTSTLLIPLRVAEIFYNECQLFGFTLATYVFLSLHGFFNFIALMLNPSLRLAIRVYLGKEEMKESVDERFIANKSST